MAKPHASKGWKIGYAQGDITPKKGQTLMTGFGRERYAEGTLAPLRAQAVALRDTKGKTALLITADILGFDRRSVEFLRRTLAARHKIDPQAVMLAASHTHWGPPTLFRVTAAVGALDPWYVVGLERRLAALADEAIKSLAPGAASYGFINAAIGHNRRLPQDDGTIGWGPYPEGFYDNHTPVLRLSRSARDVDDILLVGHACHPTSSGGINKFTPDYPGSMRDRIESKLGPRSRALFVMGCGADAKVTHLDAKSGQLVFTADPKNSAKRGRALADDVLKHLADKRAQRLDLPASLRCKVVSGNLTMTKARSPAEIEAMAMRPDNGGHEVWWARQMLAFPDARRKHYYEAQSWVLGNALTVLALEGEVCSPLGPLARGLARTPHAMTIAYANEVQGYIPTKRIVLEGGYEGESSHRAYFKPAPFTTRVEAEFKTIVRRAVK
ncbi:MAG: hypothetical protein K8S99_16485 [Planctomycetes bacterium]|nr:hypothetical protein [Planctomycetota bacterium]